ncbi:MAG: serine/threonine protein kinase [Clostridia bacterium]|nr:serine/threonine protein kinase [Clostridia bacterium]
MTRKDFIDKIREHYTVSRVLSEKENGTVLRLTHKTLQRDIILRSYPTAIVAYEKLRGIVHPNMPEVLDIHNLADGQIIIEEFIEGMTVAEVLEGGHYTYRAAKKIIEGVAAALDTLHGMEIVHRDIKPENIIVTSAGRIVLLDFNASRRIKPEKKTDTVILGTVGYAPPEQFGISQSDPKSDIYALGVLLNVMLTGVHPSEKLARGKAGKIILKCTQINPDKRFLSVLKLIEAL